MYQNIGPFEVVEKVSDATYRLRKLGTDTVTSHHVQYMNPYLTADAYEKKEVSNTSSEGIASRNTSYSPTPGDFMLFMGIPRPGKPFYLVQVKDYHEDSGDVDFHYLNNTHSRTKYRYVWVKVTSTGNHERQQMKQPPGYQADIQYAHRDDFCWTPVTVKYNGDGSIRLNQTEVKRALQHQHQPGL